MVAVLKHADYKPIAGALLADWDAKHQVVLHDRQPRLRREKQRRLRKPTCRDAGVCLCGRLGSVVHRFKLWVQTAVKEIMHSAAASVAVLVPQCGTVLRLMKVAALVEDAGAL